MMNNSTHINFIDIKNEDDGDYIISMNASSGCPDFKEGRILYLSVKNRDEKVWNVDNIPRTKYKIVKVEYNVQETYLVNVSIDLDIDVYLEKIEEVE